MADVDIVVDSGDLKAAIDLLNDYGISFTKMVNQVQTEGNRLSRASKATASQVEQAWENAQKVLNNNRLADAAKKQEQTLKQFGSNFSNILKENAREAKAQSDAILQAKKQEDATLKQFGKTFQNISRENARAAKEEGQALQDLGRRAQELLREKAMLTAAYNPLLAAEQQYLAMKNQISRASELGVLDAKQEAAALSNLEKEYRALSKGVYLAGSRFNQFGQQSGIAGKSANRFGMYAQQAGYQIGDFAVQLQSGTNAGVAFSQQAAQLAGLIPGLAGAVTAFAAIGLGLVIQNFTKSKEEATKLDDVISDFEKYEDIFKSAGVTLEDSFTTAISIVRQKYGGLVADIAKSDISGATKKLVNAVNEEFKKGNAINPEGNTGIFGQFKNANNLYGGSFSQNTINPAAIENIKLTKQYNEAIVLLKSSIEELGKSGVYTTEQLAESVAGVYDKVKSTGDLTETQLARFTELLNEAGFGEMIARVQQAQEEQVKSARELLATLELENNLRQLSIKYGEDSVQVKLAELDAEHKKARATAETEHEASGYLDQILKAIDANYEAERATIAWGNSLGYVKNQIAGIASLLASIGGGIISNAEKFTTAKLIREGATRVEAEKQVRYASEDREYEAQKQQNLEKYGNIVGTAINAAMSVDYKGGRNADEALLSAYELDAERSKAEKGSGKGRKGRKPRKSDAEKDAEKAAEKLEEFFEQFKLGMEQQERLLGVYGEQREELEKVIEIENRLGDARHLVSQKQIEAMANEELALERKLEREQELYELGSQNVENLLMTIVDGTSSIEDAFKAMLASIIREVYQQYVAKGAADWAGNFLVSLFSAKGNAFGTGGVKMFANGGVVDSPTLFNYSGGTGMMGEAGPEAIMPLKRNSQGKLGVEVSGGSSGNVSIQQHFNISANGDESVRSIIRQEMPNIANAAKAAVIEGKRRNERGL